MSALRQLQLVHRRHRSSGPRQIAPRVKGVVRENWGGRLPPRIKSAIKLIAADENKSVSWVMEELVIRFFQLPRPNYIPRKKGRA